MGIQSVAKGDTVECSSVGRVLVSAPHETLPCTEGYTFKSSTWEAKSEVQGYLWLHSEFDASVGQCSILKKTKQNRKETEGHFLCVHIQR